MDDLSNCTKEELIEQIRTLRAHNTQLRNIIAKDNAPVEQSLRKPRKPFNFEKCNFRHVLLKFFYLGWDYQGFVTQEDTANTVEHHIFSALQKTCFIENRASSNYHRCGRTDKGVSSLSQVISIDLRSKSEDIDKEINYCKMLNRVLPDNIRFYAWCPVDGNFSARFDCKGRVYKYFLPRGSLDIESMEVAANYLVGSHDFRNFCKMDVNNGVVEFVRTISSVEIDDCDSEDADKYAICIITIKGNAFLWHQIRCIVGILILVGQHKEEPEIVLELLDVMKTPRKPQYHMASEIPLNLYDCSYENVEWIYDKENLSMIIQRLHSLWTFTTIKSTMIKSMLSDLEKRAEDTDDYLSDCLFQGVKPNRYQPLKKRPLCDSLEDKIQKCSKFKKKKNQRETPPTIYCQ